MGSPTCINSEGLILSTQVSTPIGTLVLRSCPKGFHSIKPRSATDHEDEMLSLDEPMNSTATGRLHKSNDTEESAKHPELNQTRKNLQTQIDWIQEYFKDPINNKVISFSNFCFDHGTAFERKVWKALFETVQCGQTATYARLAETINNAPKAARAVGTALKKNPMLLMIPCHRIIRTDGSLGNFAGGTWNQCKKYLHEHEHHVNK